MCLIDFGMPIDAGEEHESVNNHASSTLKKLKRKQIESKNGFRKNFEFCAFREPVLFAGYVSKESVLVIEKPWMQVVKAFDAQPVHRHIYGT